MATFSKRHYEKVAGLLNDRFAEIKRDRAEPPFDRDDVHPVFMENEYAAAADALIQTASAFERMFAADNPAFDPKRFRDAVTAHVVALSDSRKAER